jgi:hypothetical protein
VLSIVITKDVPAVSVPLTITLGSAKNRAAPRTSPWRSASDHARITFTALGAAGIPVGPGVGSGWSGFTGGAGVAGEVNVPTTACVAVCVLECLAPPHPTATNPALSPIVIIATNQARGRRALT